MTEQYYVKRGKRFFRVGSEADFDGPPYLRPYPIGFTLIQHRLGGSFTYRTVKPKYAEVVAGIMDFMNELETLSKDKIFPTIDIGSQKARKLYDKFVNDVYPERVVFTLPTWREMIMEACERLRKKMGGAK